MPALVILGRRCLIASDDVPLFALPAALFHSAWTVVLLVTLTLYQQHPVCRDEGDYLPFLAGGAAAFTISSVLEWSLFSVGLTGTPLETHARQSVPLLLFLHTFASVAELGFAAYGARLLHVDTRLCTVWSPRPLAAALVGTTWAVIALNGLLTAMALNPWHGLGLVEAWEARLLWLSRLLCCRSRLLTQARVPDREPALRRIAQLTSHLLQHVDLTLSDVATAMILVAAAQRERRRRALRDAMVAAAAAHAALLCPGGPAGLQTEPGGAGVIAAGGPQERCGAVAQATSGVGAGGQAAAPCARGIGAPSASSSVCLAAAGAAAEATVAPASGLSPFLAVQQTQQQHPPQPQPVAAAAAAAAVGRHAPRVRFLAADGTELGTLHSHGLAGVAAAAAAPTVSRVPLQGGDGGEAVGAAGAAALPGTSGARAPSSRPGAGGALERPSVAAGRSLTFVNPLLSPTTSLSSDPGGSAAAAAGTGAGVSAGRDGVAGTGMGAAAATAGAQQQQQLQQLLVPASQEEVEVEAGRPQSPSRAITMMHPIVHITPAGMEEHLDELVGELVGELAAEAAEADEEAEVDACGGGSAAGGSLDLAVDLGLRSKGDGERGRNEQAVSVRQVGSAAAHEAAVAAAAAEVVTAADTQPQGGQRRTGPASAAAGAVTGPGPLSTQTSLKAAVLRKRIGNAALAAAFAAEREMVDRETLQEAAVYGRYAAAIYGSCPPDGPGKSSAWHLGGDGDDSSPDEVAAWRRRHGSSAPDPLLASILSSASRCTEHVIHVNTHNSTEGYLPYMVCLDKPTRSVVIAIRGTFSAEDIVTDCLCEPFDVRHLLHGDMPPPGPPVATTTAAAVASACAPAGPSDAPGFATGACGGGGAGDPLAAAAAPRTALGEVPAAAGVASGGGIIGGSGVGEEPVLVHAGIWAAADVIWEDLRELQLLHILLPPPDTSTSNTAATAAAGGPAAAAAGVGALSASQAASASTTLTTAAATAGPATSGSATGSSLGDMAARRGSCGRTLLAGQQPDGRRRNHPPPPPPRHLALEPQRVQHLRLDQQPQQPPRLHYPQQQLTRPNQQSISQRHLPLPSMRRRPVSLDEGRPAAAVVAYPPGPQLAATATAHGGALSDPWVSAHSGSSLDVSCRPSSVSTAHLPRLVSAERQATMPHGSGLGALLQRHRLQQRLPPPPPPAAALLPSLVLSYQPPGRTTSTPLVGGAAAGGATGKSRRRREFLPLVLRRRSSASDGGGGGGGGRRRGGGRSSAGEDGDNDNDPRAPLLLSPPPAAAAAAAGAGHSHYAPTASGDPSLLLLPSARAAALGAASGHLRGGSSRHSVDLGAAMWGAAAREPGSPTWRVVPGPAGGGRPAWSPPPPVPPPPALAATTAVQPFPTYQPAPLSGTVPSSSWVAAAPGSVGAYRHSAPTRRALSPHTNGVVGGGVASATATASASASGTEVPMSFLGRLRQAAAGVLRAAASALPGRAAVSATAEASQHSPRVREAPSQPYPLLEGGEQRGRYLERRRLGWLGQYRDRFVSASDGGARMQYTGLPRTEAEAERVAAVGGGGGGVSSIDALGRRWRSAGGAGAAGGGADVRVVDGWSAGGPYPYRQSVDLEAAEEAAEAAGSASGRQHQPATAEGEAGGEGGEGGGAPRAPLRLPEVDCSGWRVVVTGHSLGAGAAALLALRLRAALPHVEVRCWAFSPPGSLASPALSESLRPFTVSVVTGKDLIPRLSLNTMERYRDEMITALARCSCSKARVLVGSFSRRNRLRRAAHLLVPYEEIPAQARLLLRRYHEAVQRAGRLPELHPPGRILYLQPSARAGAGGGPRSGRGTGGGASSSASAPASTASSPSAPHYRPVWVSARELQAEGILASTRMLVDHSLTLCTLPALDEMLRA